MNQVNTAILIDGGFFLKRYMKVFPNGKTHTPKQVADKLVRLALGHIDPAKNENLYRIFYYDCIPFEKKIHNPLSKKVIDFAKSDMQKFRLQFFEELKRKRKIALRLGYLQERQWQIYPRPLKDLLAGKINISNLTENDIYYDLRQKGIDIKIGIDISSLAYKKLANRIVLFSGDADFVPASKLARTEGIDFILDPMWNPVNESLLEHIDGLNTTCPRPKTKMQNAVSSIPITAPPPSAS